MERFLQQSNVSKIYIIINDEDVVGTVGLIEQLVLPEYGRFSPIVSIVDGSTLYASPVAANGWRRQQSMKILISKLVQSKYYLILDAKNHFLRSSSTTDFVHEDGRMWSTRRKIDAPVNGFFWKSMRFCRLDPTLYREKAMPTVTPYVVRTDIVREIIEYVEKQCGVCFEEGFHAAGMDVTEFYLHFGYIIRYYSPIQNIYDFGDPLCASLFTRSPSTAEGFARVMKRLRSSSTLMFGLHRNRIGALSEAEQAMITRQWATSGLFDDVASADAFMRRLTESAKIACI